MGVLVSVGVGERDLVIEGLLLLGEGEVVLVGGGGGGVEGGELGFVGAGHDDMNDDTN